MMVALHEVGAGSVEAGQTLRLEQVGQEAYVGPPSAPRFTQPAQTVDPGAAWTEGDSTRWLRSLHDDPHDLAAAAGTALRAEASAAGRAVPVPSGLPEIDGLLGGLLPEVTVLTASDARLRLALTAAFGAVTDPSPRRERRASTLAAPRRVRVLGTSDADAADLRVALSVARLGTSEATVLAGGTAHSVSDCYGVLAGPREITRIRAAHPFHQPPSPTFRRAAFAPGVRAPEDARHIARLLEAEGAALDLLVVHNADAGGSRDGAAVLSGWREIARELDVPVVLVVSGRVDGWAAPDDAHVDFVRQLASTRYPSRIWFLARAIPACGAPTPASTFVYTFDTRAAGPQRGDPRSAAASYQLDAVWVPERGFDGEFDLRPTALDPRELAQVLAGRVPPPTRLLTMHDVQDALAIAMLHAPFVGEPLLNTPLDRLEDLILTIGARRAFALHLIFVANGWLSRPVAHHLARHRRRLLPIIGGRGCPGWVRAMLRGEATDERWAHRPFVIDRDDDEDPPSRPGPRPGGDDHASADLIGETPQPAGEAKPSERVTSADEASAGEADDRAIAAGVGDLGEAHRDTGDGDEGGGR